MNINININDIEKINMQKIHELTSTTELVIGGSDLGWTLGYRVRIRNRQKNIDW